MIYMETYNTNDIHIQTDTEPYYDDEDYEAENPIHLIYDDGFVEQEPRWTRRRVILFLIALIIILALVGVLIAPLLQSTMMPLPSYIPPPATPPSQL